MRIRPYSIIAFSASVAFGAVLFAAACENFKPYFDPDKVHFDAAVDYVLAPQVTHFGPSAVTCCIDALGSEATFYLANPQSGGFDNKGFPKPPFGELHLATPWGADLTLGQKVPAFGYSFSPDGSTAFYMTGVSDGSYALNAIKLNLPSLSGATPKTVITAGMDDASLDVQGFYTPTGNYFIAWPHPKGVQATTDLHVISVVGAQDILQLVSAGTFFNWATPNDVLIYENDTGSTVPGTPSKEGLYLLNLGAGLAGSPGVLIDDHTTQGSLNADGTTFIYLRANGDLVMWDLATQAYTTLANNVVNFSLGPGRKGPFAWVKTDLSVHVAWKLVPETGIGVTGYDRGVTLPANSIDLQSPIIFSSDRQHLYFFKNLNALSNYGDLYHVGFPPTGNAQANLVSVRASNLDLYFTNDRLLYLRNVSNSGDIGDLVSANFDGSDAQPMAPGVATGELQIAYPQPAQPIPPKPGGFYPNAAQRDMMTPIVQPVLANLTNAMRNNSTTLRFLNERARPVIGTLAYGPQLGQPEIAVADMVHAGQYQFSEDGYVLLYVSDAMYQATAFNFVGKLQLFQTNNNIGPTIPMLDGVSEMGPIADRGVFVAAPGAAMPGMYFVKY
jgi:hypothetical protein